MERVEASALDRGALGRPHPGRTLLAGAVLILILGTSIAYVLAGARAPWDFETYHAAATAWTQGLNPYSTAALSAVAHRPVELPFVYPPAILTFFAPWALLRVEVAAALWLSFKALLLTGLLLLWRRDVLSGTGLVSLLAVTLLGFDLAVLWDLRTGNVALLETSLLWLAFMAYRRNRYAWSASLIGSSSAFKLWPAFLLGTLVLAPRPTRQRVAFIALGVAIPILAILLPPGLVSEWWPAVTRSFAETPPVSVDPSSLAVARSLMESIGLSPSAATAAGLGTYLFFAAWMLLAAPAALRRAENDSERLLVLLLLWLLISPRLMIYSYTLAAAPALYVVRTRLWSPALRGSAVVAIVIPGLVRLLPGPTPSWTWPAPFLALLGIWLLWFRREPALRPF